MKESLLTRIRSKGAVWFILSLAIMICAVVASSMAGVISYQGQLTNADGNPVPDASYQFAFALYDDSLAGTLLWTETAIRPTINGLFDHMLGSILPLSDSLFRVYDRLYLEVTISGETTLPRTRLAYSPYAFTAAGLSVRDSLDSMAITTDAANHALSILGIDGSEQIRLSGMAVADSSVMLPESAISSTETLDEPGIAASINIDQVSLFTGVMTDLLTLDVEIPRDGYIVLHGKCYVLLEGTTGPNNALIQIDEEEGGGSSFPYYSVAGLGGYVNTDVSYFPVYVTRIYYKEAGVHTFRMEGRAGYPLPAQAKSWDHVLTAVYYPTAYSGTRSLTTDQNQSGAVPVDVQDRALPDKNGRYYLIDLRDVESQQQQSLDSVDE
jgi:hypothetical protein